MPSLRNVLVCGYYGFGNAGDEAILSILLGDLRAAHPDATVTVLAGDPEAVRIDHGTEAVSWLDLGDIIRAAQEADLMVLGGGGLFQDHVPVDPHDILSTRHGGLSYYAEFALLAGVTRTPLVVYAAGAGPIATDVGARLTRLIFDQASAATVRSRESLDALASIGVDTSDVGVAADPAWRITPGTAPEPPGGERPLFAFSIRPWKDDAHLPVFARALDLLVERTGGRILLVPFQESPKPAESDSEVALRILRSMDRADRASLAPLGLSPGERMDLLGSADTIVAMRLHAVMFGLATGRPVVAVSYDPKVRTAMSQAGLGSQVLDLDGLTPEALVEAATADPSPAEPGAVAGLREAASRAAAVFAGDPQPKDVPSQAVDIVSRVALEQVSTESDDAAQIDRLYRYNLQLQRDLAEATEDLEGLRSTKAVKLAGTYWQARQDAVQSAKRLARRLPDPIRSRLKGIAGPDLLGTRPVATADEEQRADLEAELEEILASHDQIRGIVVYPPTIGWNVALFQRPQQMALAFARLGYLVFYALNPWNEERITGFERLADRLYLMALPQGTEDLISRIPDPIAVTYIYNLAWTHGLTDPHVVFEHIDELEVFQVSHDMDQLRRWYDEAIREASVVAGSADDLHRALLSARPDAVLCPNGVDYRHFAAVSEHEPPEELVEFVGAGRPIVGYYGAIAEWVDYELIGRAATELGDHEFVFIGPNYDNTMDAHPEVFDLPNVHWFGPRPYRDLPAYLHHFDVATIPFLVNDVTHAVSPLKLFEYMAGGKPVVTPALRECARYEAVLIARDADHYVDRLREAVALGSDPEYQALLRRTARANTWDARCATLVEALARSGR